MSSLFDDLEANQLTGPETHSQAIFTAERAYAASQETEHCFKEAMQEPLNWVKRIGEARIVVGIPFYNETDTIGIVLDTIREGLEEYYPAEKCVIVAVGSPYGAEEGMEGFISKGQGHGFSYT